MTDKAMVEPLNTKASGHDPKLVAALQSLKKKLEAMPEPLRGPFLVKGLAPYVSSPALPAVDGGELVALLRQRDGEEFDGEVHLTTAEAASIAALISSQKQEIERLTKERKEALLCQQEIAAGTDKSATVARIIIAKNEADDRASAAESRVQSLEAENAIMREAFPQWLRPWVKARFGIWITHNTAIGARTEFEAHVAALKENGNG